MSVFFDWYLFLGQKVGCDVVDLVLEIQKSVLCKFIRFVWLSLGLIISLSSNVSGSRRSII